MAVMDLKKYIFEHKKIEFVLENLNCHNIRYNEKRDYYSAAQPDGDNPQGINIKNNEYLNYRSFSRGVSYDDNLDLIALVEHIKKCSFIEAVKYLHNLLGLRYTPYKKQGKKDEREFDINWIFKKIERESRRANVADIHVIDEDVLDEYVPLLHIDWLREGVMPWTAKKFGLAYSYKRKRVIIPMRYWLTGELLGINARTTIENYKELGIKKYYLTPSYQKSMNLFGLYENHDAIQKAGHCVIYEGEKSVLKRDSLADSTGVALSGHTISDEQVSILIGLNVDIVIALDKDVPIEEVRSICERFYRIRNVSYIYDRDNVLGDKDSPADAKNKDFNSLFENRVKYDESEHKKYLNSLKK